MITWQERIIKAVQAWDDWSEIPTQLRMDRAMKSAGFRDVIKKNQELREALAAMTEVATVSYGGDSWYCDNAGIDVTKAFELTRAALK